MKYFQPDIFIVTGMPGNGKSQFAIKSSLEKSNIKIFHLDIVFDTQFEDNNIYNYCNSKNFDKNHFLANFENFISIFLETTSFETTLIIEGYPATLLYEEIKQILQNKFKFKFIYKLLAQKSHSGYDIFFENEKVGISTNYDYLHILKNINEKIIKEKHINERLNYQHFPWLETTSINSNSDVKYKASFVDENIFNKSFLDVGCNSGFFCFKAKQMGSKPVVGIDNNESWIELASEVNKYFYNESDISFFVEDAFNYQPKYNFDVAFCASVFHYFKEKQRLFLEKIHSVLNTNGVFFLEIEVSPNINVDFENSIRPGDTTPMVYPSFKGVDKLIENLFIIESRNISFKQPGSLYERYFFKLRKI